MTLEDRARLVGRWVGANPGTLHSWVLEREPAGWVLVATLRVPLTVEEVAAYHAAG